MAISFKPLNLQRTWGDRQKSESGTTGNRTALAKNTSKTVVPVYGYGAMPYIYIKSTTCVVVI